MKPEQLLNGSYQTKNDSCRFAWAKFQNPLKIKKTKSKKEKRRTGHESEDCRYQKIRFRGRRR